jgi:hypothetical protein
MRQDQRRMGSEVVFNVALEYTTSLRQRFVASDIRRDFSQSPLDLCLRFERFVQRSLYGWCSHSRLILGGCDLLCHVPGI